MGRVFEVSLSKYGFLISHLSRICIDGVKFYHNYLTINRVGYNITISKLRKLINTCLCISSKLSLPQYLNYYPQKNYILYSRTLTFKSIYFYDNIINCNENILVPISMCSIPLEILTRSTPLFVQ